MPKGQQAWNRKGRFIKAKQLNSKQSHIASIFDRAEELGYKSAFPHPVEAQGYIERHQNNQPPLDERERLARIEVLVREGGFRPSEHPELAPPKNEGITRLASLIPKKNPRA